MLTYNYDLAANVTILSQGGHLIEICEGRVPHKAVHEKYGVIVFEVIKEPDVVALPPVTES
jgi:hypothetical protein